MLLWLAFALLTAAVLAAVLAPLARPARSEADADGESGTLEVYRHQLAEIEAERARGLLGAAEAEAARIEISRRLLAVAGTTGPAGSQGKAPQRAFLETRHASVALAVAIAVPLFTVGLYLAYGSPGTPSSPFASRSDAGRDQAGVATLVAQVEARLREAPDDGKGWEVIAPIYIKLGRFREAANAYANAARLNGESVKLLTGRAEASMLATDGVVTEEARTAYEKVLKIEPGRVEARFWLAMAKEQDGRLADALADYNKMLSEAPADAPYRSALTRRIGEVSARLPGAAKAASPGPSEADMAAAAKLTPEQRAQMIAQMVDGLAERLKRNGRDLAGWQRLLNAYVVLGRTEDARSALADARRNFAGDTAALGELSKLATTLGLGS